MPDPAIHFIYDPQKIPDAPFAQKLIDDLGQTPFEQAEYSVSIGGDGMLLQALRLSAGRKVCGVVTPGSNSRGFWTNRNIFMANDLLTILATAGKYPIKPLQADIEFADGTAAVRYGYNDISIRPVHKSLPEAMRAQFNLSAIDVSVQSVLLNLRVSFANAVLGPSRIMGGGLIFATPFGSTAVNHNYGGPSVDIRNEGIVLTGMGTGHPDKGFNSINNGGDAVFDVEVQSQDKRPVMVTFDSFGVVENEAGSTIKRLKVSTAQDRTVELILTDDPGLRAYAAMMP